jgi:exonuclease SbcD
MKFLHAADVHLDSPLRGLELYEGAPAARIRNATREAFENLVRLALTEKVQFVVIAGDLFDGKWTDLQTGLWVAGQFRRLEREDVAVYLIRGNHDAMAVTGQTRIQWPANVREFPVDAPSTIRDDALGVALHGRGFASREVMEDVAVTYPAAIPGLYNIGVLHTSLAGNPEHDTYAPTTVANLVRSGYDYWALGHIHLRQTVLEKPAIVWPGCIQGRHIHERGAKGCVVVTVDRGHTEVRFRPLDVLRWSLVEIELAAEARLADLYDEVATRLRACQQEAEGRFCAARIVVTGQTACHGLLQSTDGAAEAIAEIRNIANGLDEMWVEKVRLDTSPPIDMEELRRGQDLMGELVREFDRQQTAPDEELVRLGDSLAPLAGKGTLELK